MKDILSYELSKRLHEAEIVVESKYYYDIQEKELYLRPLISGYIKLSTCEFINNRNMPNDLIPAPTFLGLWGLLPRSVYMKLPEHFKDVFENGRKYDLNLFKYDDYTILSYYCHSGNDLYKKQRIVSPYNAENYQELCFENRDYEDTVVVLNEVEASAEMLLRLKEEGVI